MKTRNSTSGIFQVSFDSHYGNFEHHLNNFLSSAQSVIWTLNKAFGKRAGYDEWLAKRVDRFSSAAKNFKEMRNVSVKEDPIRHTGVIIGFDLGAVGITVPPHAEVIGPWVDTWTGKFAREVTIKLVDGTEQKVEPLWLHDFSVYIQDGKKIYKIQYFINRHSPDGFQTRPIW